LRHRVSSARPARIPAERLAPLRAANQLLHRPAGLRHAADVAAAIVGAQAQDLPAGRLAFRARSRTLRAGDIDRARNEERSLLRTWVMRGTLHLIAAEDERWIVPLFSAQVAAESRRRLAQLGLEAALRDRALRLLKRRLRSAGPIARAELMEELERAGLATQQLRGQLVRVAIAEGIACQGPDLGSKPSLVDARDWLGERPAHDRSRALAELARRYLRAFGPATEADFAGWAGLGRRECREAIAAIGGEVRRVEIGSDQGWALRRGTRRPPRKPPLRLVPAWDTYLIGHRDRSFIAEAERWRRIMPGGGVLRATVLLGGRALGTWGSRRAGGRLEVAVTPFGALDRELEPQLEAELRDLARFEDLPLATRASAAHSPS
jgi:hypothetical protein